MQPFLHRHFERKREIFFVRGQAKVVREAGNGKHRMLHVIGDHVLHADGFTKENSKRQTKKIPRLRSG